jgi:hypothetical protein
MFNKSLTILCLAALVSLPACKSSSTKSPDKARNVTSKQSVNTSNQPYWILDSQLKGHLAVVGSAGKQDFGGKEAQYRVAISKARAELAKIYRTRIESVTEMNQSDQGTTMNTATRASSSEGLRLHDAIVLEKWTDPATGELFIWLVLPIK